MKVDDDVMQLSIAIEGHDASGKTSVALALAREMDGVYIKPFLYLGDFLEWTWKTRKFHVTDRAARLAIEASLEDNADKSVLVFDRHWFTHFTVMPLEYLKNWGQLPITILLWTDAETTRERLRQRGEPTDAYDHQHYCDLYGAMAVKYGIPVVDTTNITVEEALLKVKSIIEMRQVYRGTSAYSYSSI